MEGKIEDTIETKDTKYIIEGKKGSGVLPMLSLLQKKTKIQNIS